jgi:hypothetical protein
MSDPPAPPSSPDSSSSLRVVIPDFGDPEEIIDRHSGSGTIEEIPPGWDDPDFLDEPLPKPFVPDILPDVIPYEVPMRHEVNSVITSVIATVMGVGTLVNDMEDLGKTIFKAALTAAIAGMASKAGIAFYGLLSNAFRFTVKAASVYAKGLFTRLRR